MTPTEIADLSATEMRRLIGRRELSPVEVVEACLARVDQHNGLINAVCTLSETALDEASQAEEILARDGELGLLHGLPVGIKDVTPTAGLRTTFGSPVYAEHVPEEDALIVQRLKAAGAVVLGKTNTPEFAAGANTFNDVFGPTRNPWNPRRSAGGSTGGGAAALAARMIALAEGTDLGGSLRIPAAFCGVVGLRPSPGLVPIHPTEFLWDTLAVAGPVARTAEDVALVLQAISGSSPFSPLHQPNQGRNFVEAVRSGPAARLRLAFAADPSGIGVEEELLGICRTAAFEMDQEGNQVEEVDMNLSHGREAFHALRGLWMVAHHHFHLDKSERFGANLSGNIRFGLEVSTEQLGAAEQIRLRLWDTFRQLFQKFDHLLTPCTAVSPFPVEQSHPTSLGGQLLETYIDWFAPTFLLSLTGLPVVSVPCGKDKEGLPVGLQIVGPPGGEESVLALASVIQKACPIGLPDM